MDTEIKQTVEEKIEVIENDAVENTVENSGVQESIDIEAIKKSLDAKAEELAKWQAALSEKESSLETEALRIQKEKVVLEEREKTAESELKQKIDTEYTEARAKLNDEQNKSREELSAELEKKRSEFEASRKKALEDLDQELKKIRENAQTEIDTARRNQESELRRRREETEQELQKQRKENQDAIKEDKEKALEELKAEIEQRTADLTRGENALSSERERVKAERERVEALEAGIAKREDDLLDQNRVLEREKRRLEREKSRIDEANDNLETVVNEKIEDTIKNLQQMIAAKNQELENLRNQLSSTVKEIELVKSFKEAYGDDPQVLIQTLKQLEESNTTLRNKLANCSDKTEFDNLSAAYREAKAELDRLLEENRHLSDSQGRFSTLEAQFRTLDSEHKSLQATCESLENQLEAKNQEIVRLSTPEGRVADRDARIAAIMTGALEDKKDLIGAGEGFDSRSSTKDEVAWLEDVWSKCGNYGIKFNKRILYAFHTALKINEWSTITVLAGVSGTGKSELPRLYAEFGGLNFCSVAVQPNWDSQESMLGFFNSIDNQFEPEELLKFLVQCTTDPRYSDYMSIVLLDEMNLAHVEHYFAEFLSKLESRRGLSKSYLPEIEVKLGAGVKPYGLKLSRTLLWTGTMNQDETTKSLSDKVLDRGIVINFPRPRKLESRTKMGLITDFIGNDRPKMHKSTWESWTSHVIEFSEEQMEEIENYRLIVQKINNALEEVGRALGHRVWQSIEYYIANYPTVRQEMRYEPRQNEKGKTVWVPTNTELTGELRAAMKTAFEDQIVQKIMPKLRGIETRDKRGKSSLDAIEDLLVTHDFTSLQEDFQIAREQGFGQFIWNSAKYLDEKENEVKE